MEKSKERTKKRKEKEIDLNDVYLQFNTLQNTINSLAKANQTVPSEEEVRELYERKIRLQTLKKEREIKNKGEDMLTDEMLYFTARDLNHITNDIGTKLLRLSVYHPVRLTHDAFIVADIVDAIDTIGCYDNFIKDLNSFLSKDKTLKPYEEVENFIMKALEEHTMLFVISPVERDWLSDTEYVSEDVFIDDIRQTVKFIISRIWREYYLIYSEEAVLDKKEVDYHA